ncbi:MAG: hypothetical protein ACI8S6_000468 [Myxococcota bacterium]|jgi:hypothetical protein
MNHFLSMLLLITATGAAAPGTLGPEPGILDTAGANDSSLDREQMFGSTPAEHCSNQVLRGGVQVPDRPELYSYWDAKKAWGTPEMIHAVTVASEEMAWLMPHADPIVIGDISQKFGGLLSGHKSHRGGVDADIGIFTTGSKQPDSGGFTGVTPSNIDYEANWLFWRSLLETGLVDRILLDQPLIDAMRGWTVAEGELSAAEALEVFPPRGTPRIWAMTGVFQHAVNHHHHIHLRVLCGEEIPRIN